MAFWASAGRAASSAHSTIPTNAMGNRRMTGPLAGRCDRQHWSGAGCNAPSRRRPARLLILVSREVVGTPKLCGSGNAEGEAEGGGPRRLLLNGWKLLGLHREMRPAILAPAILAGIVADRALLAVADHRDPVRSDASRDQIVHR